MKSQFGFIERADVVKEIFFHYSEFLGNIDDLELGEDVSFKVAQRNVRTPKEFRVQLVVKFMANFCHG